MLTNSISLRSSAGFTLIELAVVVAIVGLLLGGLLLPLATQVDARRVEATEDDLVEIRDALYGYMVSSNPSPPPAGAVVTRLPCPDCMEATDGDCGTLPGIEIADGQEDYHLTLGQCASWMGGATHATATTYQGYVPWVTLGVSQFDSWNRNYRYAVSMEFADGAPHTCGNPTTSFGLCTDGDLTVVGSVGDGSPRVAEKMAAIVLSLGENTERELCSEAAEPSPDQDENVDCTDTTFVANTRVEDPGNEFDDVVLWVSPNLIKSKLIDVNILP